ncbi:MAG: hypothetical protein QG575_866 [Euryarchaeota archaeon]|nr:hypothetical protein [Euryarchaeota archaeon]
MDKQMRRDKRCVSFVIFIFSVLSSLGCALAQCGDCEDNNPCTTDFCDGMTCQHTPQSCDGANSSAWTSFGKGADISVPKSAEIPGQKQQEPSALKEAVNMPVSCDDNNPCTRDSYGANGCVHDPVNCNDASPCTTDYCAANGCVHDPVNCDDGNANTTDFCGSSGCINTPLPAENSKSYSRESLIPDVSESEIKKEAEKDNTTINESQSVIDKGESQPICDDGNPCTTDAYDGTNCVYTSLNCDDENDSTLDSCIDGACINEPRDSISMLSENNSTTLSSGEALMAQHSCDDHDPCTEDTFDGIKCEHKPKNCDDADPNTFDYCFEGVCYHTTTNCDDGNPCTIDSFNGSACVHIPMNCDDHNACTIDTCKDGKCVHTPRNCDDGNPCTSDKCNRKTGCYSTWKCDDGNPCTVDYCDSVRGCLHKPVVCAPGKTCVDGVCQYLYYPYARPYYPYYQPYVAPTAASTIPTAQSYTIPAGTAITLPWTSSVTSLNTLTVENGIAYPGASPLKFVRSLSLEDQAILGYQTGQSISERSEMIGLSWKDAGFILTLVQPNGSTLPVLGDNRNVIHLVGPNYDYYFLGDAVNGNWGIEIKPINPGANGVGFSLITGQVKGAAPINQP